MEMARRSKQKIVRKLPEQDFGGGWSGGGGRGRQKNVSNEHSNFSYEKKC